MDWFYVAVVFAAAAAAAAAGFTIKQKLFKKIALANKALLLFLLLCQPFLLFGPKSALGTTAAAAKKMVVFAAHCY